MKPEDVDDDLEALAREAERAYDRSVRSGWDDGENRRAILAAVLPAHERRVREQLAANARAAADQFAERQMTDEAATLRWFADRIARGEP